MEELSERVAILEAMMSKLVKWTNFVPDADNKDVGGTTNKENSSGETFQNNYDDNPNPGTSYPDSDQIYIEEEIKMENVEEEMIINVIPSYDVDDDKSSEYDSQSAYNNGDPLGDFSSGQVVSSAYRKDKNSSIFTREPCPTEQDEVTIIDEVENEDVILCDDEVPSTSRNISGPSRTQFVASRFHKKVEKRDIRGHTVNTLESEVVYCPICNKGLKSKHSLKMHVFTIHNAEPNFKCAQCQEKFMLKHELDQHRIQGCSPAAIQCANCPLMFRRQADLYAHIRTDHAELAFPCPNCDKTFARKYNLIRHERTHREVAFQHICSVCSSKFATLSGLKLHLNGHELDQKYKHFAKTFTCAHCVKKFSIRQSFQLHEIFHQKVHELPFECVECEVRFSTEILLLHHFDTSKQHGRHNFRCLYCEKTFERKYNLVRHELSHTHGSRRPRDGPPTPNPAILKAREEERITKLALGYDGSNGNESDENMGQDEEQNEEDDDSDCFIKRPYEYAY